ncbi:hypothetical protein [Streptomyces sp. R35]|uniref:Tetratricopeptide repeat protein n=1 Tax=Streptomyces sp. R35 TaxID=3238630 RepID=A0AB39S9I7_9ACTN
MESLLRARELAGARKFRESRALVERAEPEGAQELSLAASVLVQLRDPEAALPLARRAVELDPQGWRGHLAVADATYQLRRWEESVAAARTAVELAPEEATAHRALAAALNRTLGGGREARREAKWAKELGGRKAMRMPGRPSPWPALTLVLPGIVAGTLLLVRDWSDGVENVLELVQVMPFAVGLLIVWAPARAGLTWRERIAEIRAANEERYRGGGRAARLRAGLAATPWGCAVGVGAGLLADRARFGDPLPASVVVPAVLVGGCVLAVLARRTVRLWYGERFLREVFVPSLAVRVHLVAAGVLGGGVLLLTFGDAPRESWRVLQTWTVVWFLLSIAAVPVLRGAGLSGEPDGKGLDR